jgi:tetratricopeptide (TPR) repeat protein
MVNAPRRTDTAAPARRRVSGLLGLLRVLGMDRWRSAARVSVLPALLALVLALAQAAAAGGAGLSFYDLGVFAYEEGQYHRAVRHFNRALRSRPRDPFLRLYLGRSYLELDRPGPAERHLTEARELDPDLPGLDYYLGLARFRQEEYGPASESFVRAARQGPKRALAGYYAGVSLYRQSRCREALDYLMRASRSGGELGSNALYFAALCELKLDRPARGRKMLERVAAEAGSQRLRESAAGTLERMRQRSGRRFHLYAEAGYEYDSNVPLEPEDVDLVADEADHAVSGYLSASYDAVRTGPFLMGAGYSHYQTWHEDLEAFDVIAGVPSVYSRLRVGPSSLGLAYSPVYYWVDGDSFLRSHELSPSVEWRVTEAFTARASYTYADQEFFDDRGRSGHYHEIALDLTRTFLGGRLALLAGGGYRDKSASRSDEAFGRAEGELGFSVSLPLGLSLLTIGEYERAEYDEPDRVFGEVREDELYRGTLALSHPFLRDDVGIVLEYEYTRNDSSISFYEYDRHTVSVSWTFEY